MKHLVFLLLLVLSVSRVTADAVIRTQAMNASTIVEYFVEPDRVLVELEIGPQDLEIFSKLLHDDLWEKIGNTPTPLAERLQDFSENDFVIAPDGGGPVSVRLMEIRPRPRIRRDEISGEPLPPDPGSEETVIFVRLEYPLKEKPRSLHIGGQAATRTAVGFVVYHGGIAVNDFRYLSAGQLLHLDWDDPFYTAFETRGLRRSYYLPMSGFLYIEPNEVRKEIVARPKDLQRWVDLGIEGGSVIPVAIQPALKGKVAGFLQQHQKITIDGVEVPAQLAQINFLQRSLKTSRVIEPPEELDLNAAVLGVIFVYPTSGLPQKVSMEWDLFSERIQKVSAAAVDQAGSMPSFLEPGFETLEWINFLKNPELPTLVELSPPSPLSVRIFAAARWPFVGLTLLMAGLFVAGARRRGSLPRGMAIVVLVAAGLSSLSLWSARDTALSTDRTDTIVTGLLHNIYRSFDYRDEEEIYDVLEKSVAGDLLTRIYLETRRGLVLANQGGARAKVKAIELAELETKQTTGGGFHAEATWVVSASVGHWGHIHQRRNQYRAAMDITPVDGEWKLTGMEVLEEERL